MRGDARLGPVLEKNHAAELSRLRNC